ncbi:unnamed protein product [Bursaphelenchus okinawaensis]|uniref:DUF148 domain-containing protein n=1 Tax=Bursaphelenchus okinawaensis TaxID=465554 RepID=A0A811L6F9_9BILA|nr:unnamed protein product [Bursaphelenchus okinawaensis]CAG9117420.1 unnamed protein product [Bursaphelenchus okinawaensis]
MCCVFCDFTLQNEIVTKSHFQLLAGVIALEKMQPTLITALLLPLCLARPQAEVPVESSTGLAGIAQKFGSLPEGVQSQLKNIFTENQNATKAQLKSSIKDLVSNLPEQFQTQAKAAKAAFEQRIQDAQTKLSGLGQAAQDLANQAISIIKNDNLTLQETKEQLKTLVQNADPSALEEVESASILPEKIVDRIEGNHDQSELLPQE